MENKKSVKPPTSQYWAIMINHWVTGFGIPDFQTPKKSSTNSGCSDLLPSLRGGSTFLQASKVTTDSWWFMPFWAVESGKQHHVLICFLIYPDCEPFRSNLERLSKTQDMAQQPGTNGPTQFLLFTIQPCQNWGQIWNCTQFDDIPLQHGNYMGTI